MVVAGGSGYQLGPFVGALLGVVLPEWLRFTGGLYLIVFRSDRGGPADRLSARHHRPHGTWLARLAAARNREGGRRMTTVLEVEGLKKHFGGIKAVDGVSFTVEEGEILGIIGPNGCGKSTLFNCILGQLSPRKGGSGWTGRTLPALRPKPSTGGA